jgi:hypothetical protein
MKRKYWWIFGVLQVLGILATAEAVLLQFPLLWAVSMLVLLPGSLAFFSGFDLRLLGTTWSPWMLCATAVTTNVLLFAVASFVLARHRKPN